MAWTNPKNWNFKDVLSSSDLNTYLRDNMNALRDGSGLANQSIKSKHMSPTIYSATTSNNQKITSQGSWTTLIDNTFTIDDPGTNAYAICMHKSSIYFDAYCPAWSATIRFCLDGTTGYDYDNLHKTSASGLWDNNTMCLFAKIPLTTGSTHTITVQAQTDHPHGFNIRWASTIIVVVAQ